MADLEEIIVSSLNTKQSWLVFGNCNIVDLLRWLVSGVRKRSEVRRNGEVLRQEFKRGVLVVS